MNYFREILDYLNCLKEQICLLKKTIKKIEYDVQLEFKKIAKQRNKKSVNRKPSGFATPRVVSDKLCDFMNCPRGSLVPRTEVTQYIIKYIKNNNLQSENNRRIIHPDKSLKVLLGDMGEDLTYFNIQRYMNQHFCFT